jgi:uncharacterized protein YukE
MSKVYVDPTVMSEWKTQMETINKDCISSIEEINTAITKLNDSFQGDYATKYEESFGSFTSKVKSSHESLRNVESFLDTIVNVMENQ